MSDERLLEQQPSREVVAEAAAWITRLHGSRRTPEVEAGFRDWLAADEQHARTFEDMTELWDTVPSVSAPPVPRVQRWQPPRHSTQRWGMAAMLIVLAGLSWASYHWLRAPVYATAIGEQRIVNLDDGSRVSINSRTQLSLAYSEAERRVVLDQGEVFFEVAHDSSRPFVVVAGGREVTAIGTSFVVRHEAGVTSVVLLEGKVAVAERDQKTQTPVMLIAGERIRFESEHASPDIDRPAVDTVASWRRGQVMLDETLLSEAVAEMNRYDKKQIVIDDDTIASLPVSGVYRTGDSLGFARMAARMYGIECSERDGRIHLHR